MWIIQWNTSNNRMMHSIIYSVLELSKFMTLEDILECNGKMNEKCCLYFFIQMVRIIELMHSRGYYHLHLSPACFLVGDDFQLKLTNFLYAEKKEAAYCLPQSAKRTSDYLPPEIINGAPFDGTKVDSFSIGAILFTLATNSNIFSIAGEKYKKEGIKSSDFRALANNIQPELLKGLSLEFILMVCSMILGNPIKRWTLNALEISNWTSQVAGKEEILQYLNSPKTKPSSLQQPVFGSLEPIQNYQVCGVKVPTKSSSTNETRTNQSNQGLINPNNSSAFVETIPLPPTDVHSRMPTFLDQLESSSFILPAREVAKSIVSACVENGRTNIKYYQRRRIRIV